MIRAVRSLLAILALPLLLGACTGSDSSTNLDRCLNAFNVASPVDQGFSDFTVNTQLQYTWYRDTLAGLQATSGNSDDEAVSAALETLIDEYIQFQGDAESYTSVTNDLDLLENLIVQGTVDNFEQGREAIAGCIDEGKAALYQNNNISLRDIDDNNDTEQQWNMILRYDYQPDNERVVRTIIGNSTGTQSVVRYDETTFNATGFNSPDEAFISMAPLATDAADILSRVEIPEAKVDFLVWSGEQVRDFGVDFEEDQPNQKYDYLLIRLDYAMQLVTLWGSKVGQPTQCNPATFLGSSGADSRQACIDAMEDLSNETTTDDSDNEVPAGGLLHDYESAAVSERQ